MLMRLDPGSHVGVGCEVDQQAPSPARAPEDVTPSSLATVSTPRTIDGNSYTEEDPPKREPQVL